MIESGMPRVATTMTPLSVRRTPTICTNETRVPCVTSDPARTITGIEPCRMPMLMALV